LDPLGFLPILAFAVLFLGLLQIEGDEGGAFVEATLLWSVYAVLVKEGLSIFRAISGPALTVAWGLLSLASVGLLLWSSRRRGRVVLPRFRIPRPTAARVAAAGVVIVLVLTAVVSWFAPPNTWDALTYHMSRIAQWAQAGSIAHFSTGIEAQNFTPPAA
jgi:hypothetical protein